MAARNDIKLATVKGDNAAEQFCYGYDTAVGEMEALLDELLVFEN